VSGPGRLATIRFGTDGWRAVIAEDFTFANVERVAQAYAVYLLKQEQDGSDSAGPAGPNPPVVIIGYDRRFLSERFAERAAEILGGNGLGIRLFGEPVPTPLVSWAVRELSAAGGVVITASHNPPDFNGFKIKASWGGSASPEMTRAVESLVDALVPRRAVDVTTPAAQEILEAVVESYRAHVARYIEMESVRGLRARVIIDPMHGAAGRWVESLLGGSTRGRALEVETIRADRDPLFGGVNPEPIDRNLGPLKLRVKETGAIIGLATDGDADRLGAVNERGETMTMHEVVPLLLLHLARRRGMTGGVVRTFSQSVLTRRIAAAHNLPLYDTPIGFKYIADLMMREDILLGGEESGGIGIKGHLPERDGLLNSLLLLEAVAASLRTPSEMVRDMHREFGEFYFDRRDLHMEVSRGQNLVAGLATNPPASVADFAVRDVETLDGTKLLFDDESWLLLRQSGTEPVLRIYSEATSRAKTQALLDEGERLARALP
jgi:phosphomannomutase